MHCTHTPLLLPMKLIVSSDGFAHFTVYYRILKCGVLIKSDTQRSIELLIHLADHFGYSSGFVIYFFFSSRIERFMKIRLTHQRLLIEDNKSTKFPFFFSLSFSMWFAFEMLHGCPREFIHLKCVHNFKNTL